MTTQHTLFPADAETTQPQERRRLTKEDIEKVRHVEGFPIATDEAIIALSDPPHYTACPNPFLADFIAKHGRPYDEATDDYHREPFAADVSEGKNDPIYNAHSYHTKVPHKAIMRYILHYTEPGYIVFDGFCGTGMTAVAAQLCADHAMVESLGYRVDRDGTIYEGNTPISKLGARKAVLSDLSPAATFIAYKYNTPVDIAAFQREAKRILAEVEEECGWMYETTHTDGRKGRINYTVWSEVFICHSCSQEIVFLERALDEESGQVNREFNCPHCGVNVSKRTMIRAFDSYYDNLNNEICNRVKRVPVQID